MKIVILGLTITSSWGNGHATTYRALVRELDRRGHDVLFLEREKPWYADNRDMPNPPWGRLGLYEDLRELSWWEDEITSADAVILGSFTPDAITIAGWLAEVAPGVRAFYDIDTPVTMARLARGECEYLSRSIIPSFDLYLSFTGGPILRRIERDFGAKRARALYCSVDSEGYFPEAAKKSWDLGYMGTYSDDRQPKLQNLLLDVAEAWPEGRFVVAGPQYPGGIDWRNVERFEHLPPSQHRRFYNRQRATLNITRADMVEAGWSPSVRLFEAAACGTPIFSDWWEGLDSLFLPEREILIVETPKDVLRHLRDRPAEELLAIGRAARKRVLSLHTAAQRAAELEAYLAEARQDWPSSQAAHA